MFARLILSWLGWKQAAVCAPAPNVPCVVICYPHTCYYDGFLTILLAAIHYGYMAGKADNPFFRALCWLTGSIPISRANGGPSQTDQVAAFLWHSRGHLYVAPEGSRKRAAKIRSGFYHIARKTGRPIVCGNFDYRTKEYSFSAPFDVGELTFEETAQKIGAYYRDAGLLESGKHPERTTPFAAPKSD